MMKKDNACVKRFKLHNAGNSGPEVVPNLNRNVKDSENNVTKQEDFHDEIYGTCIDTETFLCESDYKHELLENNEQHFRYKPAVENTIHVPSDIEIPTREITRSVQTKINITYTQKSNNENVFTIHPNTCETNKEMKAESEQDTELAQNQLSLIRQIFNSKMYMKDVLGCYSSEENIYMNNKSLPRTNENSEKNNNEVEIGRNYKDVNPNGMKEVLGPKKQNKSRKNSYLETAIDDAFGDRDQPLLDVGKIETNTNINDENYLKNPPVEAKDDQDVMARCQNLEDKINEILVTQSKNQQIKSNHISDLDMLLQEKLGRIRQHETYIKNKEKQLQNFELNLNKRERSLAVQEKMVREKIQRAQVYLQQCKDSRRNLGLRTPIELELKPLKENLKLFNADLGTAHEMEQDKLTKNANKSNQLHLKISKTSLPTRKNKDTPGLEMKRHSVIDNDSSFSADPGDTSILPTMCKLDPDKVKPIKHYRHVHFKDEFVELFNDIDEMCQNRKKSTDQDFNNNDNISKDSETREDVQNNNLGLAMATKYSNSVQPEINHPIIPSRQSEVFRLLRLSTNTNFQINNVLDRKSNMINSHPSTSSVKLDNHEKSSIPHKTKQLCISNHHTRQKHSISDIKLHSVEERKPLLNLFTNSNIPKQQSRSSGLVGPGFISSTLNTKAHKDDQIKSAKIKTSSMLPVGNRHVQSKGVSMQTNDQENALTGMRKHFVKSKTSLTTNSNSNVQQWLRKSMRNKENLGQSKENSSTEGKVIEFHDRRTDACLQGDESNLKQLNADNLDIVRKHLQPLSAQNCLSTEVQLQGYLENKICRFGAVSSHI